LVDEKLKYSKPSHTETLFDLISQDTKEKIEESKIEVKAEGIKLTPPENKSFMHSTGYYTRTAKQITQKLMIFTVEMHHLYSFLMESQEQKAAVLKFKPSELYKAYMGKDDYSGADIAFINNTLHQLESKRC